MVDYAEGRYRTTAEMLETLFGKKSRGRAGMLRYDAVAWLKMQEGLAATRARRLAGIDERGDEDVVQALLRRLTRAQRADGSFEGSVMKTAGILNLLDDLRATQAEELTQRGASHLLTVLEAQPGYERGRKIGHHGLVNECDLCGFFGPYEERNRPDVLALGAREMNFYREYEPLLGPKAPVRSSRRSSLDRVGPGSCYAWGLIPLAYTIEAVCRAGRAMDKRLKPAMNVLLAAQRKSGGWCRGAGGHPSCSIHGLRALGAHPELRRSEYALEALTFMRRTLKGRDRKMAAWWRGSRLFALMQAMPAFGLPVAREIVRDALSETGRRQKKDGSFGGPCAVERVAAVLVAARTVE